MKPYLLDTSLLIALAWPNHVHYAAAQTWFSKKRRAGFRTCPLTQAGFVRISSNPAFTPQAVTPAEALALLDVITSLPSHEFWPDDLSLTEAMAGKPMLTGHRQVTDLYLLALASAHEGTLATLDRGILALAQRRGSTAEVVG